MQLRFFDSNQPASVSLLCEKCNHNIEKTLHSDPDCRSNIRTAVKSFFEDFSMTENGAE